MALTASGSRWWSRLHLLVRFLGLTGLLLLAVGQALTFLETKPTWDLFLAAIRREVGNPILLWASWLSLGGGAAALLALAVEIFVIFVVAAGRRSAFGFNVFLQVILALALAIGVNVFSFRHYLRLDWTRQRQFTLAPEIQEQLRQLRSPRIAKHMSELERKEEEKNTTTIVVYRLHKTFGRLSEEMDAYDYAAEEKVVEKVKDLVDQFREFGPQFQVVVLDVKEKEASPSAAEAGASAPADSVEGFRRKEKSFSEKLKDCFPDEEVPKELTKAIDSAVENTIFFYARGKVQRLSFNDFYQLDKTASRQEGNLVLVSQGVEPFTRKVLNIDEKPPRIAFAVIHDLLSTEGGESKFTFKGARKSLEVHRLEVKDIILKKLRGFSIVGPGAYTFAEGRYERLENEIKVLDQVIVQLEKNYQKFQAIRKDWEKLSLKELTEKYRTELRGSEVTEALRRRQLRYFDEELLPEQKENLDALREKKAGMLKEKAALNVEDVAELQRMTDLKAKMDRLLSDCDLLILPRMTMLDLNLRQVIPSRLYRLDDAQVEAIKEFLKAGKPVLALFGPTNEPPDIPPEMEGPDALEKLFSDLGIQFGKTVVLFDVESPTLASSQSGQEQTLSAGVNIPPVQFDWKTGDAWPHKPSDLLKTSDVSARKVNRIRASMLLASRSAGKNLDLEVQYPRPVYFEPPAGSGPAISPEIMLTSPNAWNEDQPFATLERTPHFEEPKLKDPSKGTRDEKRHGRFTIGVATEVTLPASWYEGKGTPKRVRVAAIGNGGIFTGPEMSPAKEKLLLDACNWLLGRDDLLPQGVAENLRAREWKYPRVNLDRREYDVWHWGTRLGLPVLFAYIGLVVLMVRKLR